jgi:polar amino acid transport system substrate-binding protein
MPVNGDPESERTGYFIEVLRAIGERRGFAVDYALSSWDIAVADATAGRIDCIVGAARNDAPGLVFPRQPWLTLQTGLYVHADHPLAASAGRPGAADAFAAGDWTLGLLASYAYVAEVTALAERLAPERVVRVGGAMRFPLPLLVHRAVTGKVDAFVEADHVLHAYTSSIGLDDRLVKIADLGAPQAVYVACHQRALITVIEQGHQELASSGALSALKQKYGLSEESNTRGAGAASDSDQTVFTD